MRPLSERETDVLRLLADGAAIKVAAYKLGLTISTASRDAEKIIRKLDAANMYNAIFKAAKAGLI